MEDDPMIRPLVSRKPVQVGSFSVLPFDVKHDASEPLGFLIEHKEIGRLLFVTDSYLLRYSFRGVTHWLIECNYNTDILQERLAAGAVHPAQYKRTLLSHMSYEACRKTLLASDLTATRHIMLIHLSDGNSDAERCRQGIAEVTGKDVRVATRGMTIEVNRTPF
jgi:metallo-beta-lactamase domain-containing protein